MTEQREEYHIKLESGGKDLHLASETKRGHGGRRIAGEGKKIGRPQKGDDKRVPMSFKLPPLLANKLKGEESRTGLLVKLLAEYYGVNLKDLDIG